MGEPKVAPPGRQTPAGLDDDALTPVVRAALDSDSASIIEWSVTPLGSNDVHFGGGGLFLVSGSVDDRGVRRSGRWCSSRSLASTQTGLEIHRRTRRLRLLETGAPRVRVRPPRTLAGTHRGAEMLPRRRAWTRPPLDPEWVAGVWGRPAMEVVAQNALLASFLDRRASEAQQLLGRI